VPEDKPVPLRPATPARSRLRPVAEPTPEVESDAGLGEGDADSAPPDRLVDRIQELAERIEEETAATRAETERDSELPARAVRAAAATKAEKAAQRVAGAAKGRHEAPQPLPPVPLPEEPRVVSLDKPEADAPVAKAPANKAPAKKAPAKATTAPAKKAPAKKAAAKKAPAKTGGTTTAGVRRGVPAPPARPLPRPTAGAATPAPPPPAAPPPPRVVAPTTVVPAQRKSSRGARVLAVLSVLLLAVAAGLGTAAYVLTGEQTWESRAAVRLVAGPAPTVDPTTAVRNGVDRYGDKVPGFTLTAATAMGVPQDDVRGSFETANPEPDVIGIVVRASHRNQAVLLAGAAANELIKTVTQDEKTVAPSAADRLAAVVTGTATTPERTRPDDAVAGLAGGLAALAVLLVGGLVAILRRS